MTITRLPTAAVADVVARLLSSREDGIPQLADEIAGTLDLNARSCERRLRAILNAETENVDLDVVDWVLQGAGATHLWYEPPLLKFLPDPGTDPVVEHDETCAECRRWIDWSRGDAGVRVELRRPRRWPEWWSLCARCYARSGIGASGFGQLTFERLLELYEDYLDKQFGASVLGARLFPETTYGNVHSCVSALTQGWTRNGWPMRTRGEQRSLNVKRRGRRRRPPRKIPVADLRTLNRLHLAKWVSINELARQVHERYGYAGPSGRSQCASAICMGWKILGLKAHDRIAMTVHASTKNGLSPRDWQTRKAVRLAAGLTQHGKPRRSPCAASCRGRRCKRAALVDSAYCMNHDPRRAAERAAQLASMRDRNPYLQKPRTTAARVQPALVEWFAANEGRWAGLPAATGFSNSLLGRVKNGPADRSIHVETAEKIEAAIAQLTAAVPITERAPELEDLAA